MAEKLEFTNLELLQLSQEIQGLLGEKLSIFVKYKLTELFEQISKYTKLYMDTRNEVIQELAPDGNIPNTIEKDGKQVVNPLLNEFIEKMRPTDEDVKEITFKKLDFSLIKNIETEKNFQLLFKFFNIEEEPTENK